MYVLLSRNQAEPARIVNQEEEQTCPNLITFFSGALYRMKPGTLRQLSDQLINKSTIEDYLVT